MKNTMKLLIFCLLFACHSKKETKENSEANYLQRNILGFYEYQAPKGGNNQYILIDTLRGKFYGIFYRAEPRRGNGQDYYASSLTKFKFEGDSVSFIQDARKLFNSRPVSPGKRSVNNSIPTGSVNSGALYFTGTLINSFLRIKCSSKNGDCQDNSMVFKKIPLPE